MTESVNTVVGVPPVVVRPTWRGRLHEVAFLLTIPAGAWLIVAAKGAAATATASIFVASMLLLFGTSASYHCFAQSEHARSVMQRLDHSMIYVLITGTYVPLCLVALPPAWGIPVLAVIGAAAITGIVLKLAAFHRRRVNLATNALYPVMGWTAIVAMPALVSQLTAAQLILVAGGGVAYTIGFPVLFRRRPDPWPSTFGYHEIWHSLTVVAAGMHFAAVFSVVT